MSNTKELLSVEQVAASLGVHVRTVRRYLREGRLQGRKIGKQYRIAASDLAKLTGQEERAVLSEVRRHRHAEAAVIVQIDAIDPDGAMRLVNGIGGAVRGRDKHSDMPLRVDTIYDESRARLKVVFTGGVSTAAGLLLLLETMLRD